MKTLNAYTEEIDDNEAAVKELVQQLNYPDAFLKNSLAIVQFNSEYIESGMYAQLREALPIDMIGCSTMYTGINKSSGEFAFSMFVITGDDLEFKVISTSQIDNRDRFDEINAKIISVAQNIDTASSLILTCCGIFGSFGGDELVDAIDSVTGGQIPLFGTIAWDSMDQVNRSYVVCNDIISTDFVAFACVTGNCKPSFIRASGIDETTLGSIFSCTITEAERTLLKTVDNIPIVKFLKDKGVFKGVDMWVLPAIMKMNNGEYVGRAFIGNFDSMHVEDGIISTGRLEVGANIAFTYLDKNSVIDSATTVFVKFKQLQVRNTINFSCVARSWALGTQVEAEFNAIDAQTDNDTTYILGYSGGELCPLILADGSVKNLFHNYSLVTCILE